MEDEGFRMQAKAGKIASDCKLISDCGRLFVFFILSFILTSLIVHKLGKL
jgi:hypothetical protein